MGKLAGSFDVSFFPAAQGGVEIEIGMALQFAQGMGHEFGVAGKSRRWRNGDGSLGQGCGAGDIEFTFDLVQTDRAPGIFGDQTNGDVAQFPHVAGKRVAE